MGGMWGPSLLHDAREKEAKYLAYAEKTDTLGKRIGLKIRDNIVTIIVVLFIVVGLYASEGLSVSFFVNELLSRIFRNGFLVLALIIPVIAGLGLNFGIVAGALAGMLATLFIRYHAGVECAACIEIMSASFEGGTCAAWPGCAPWAGLGGLSGLMLCFILSAPIAMLIGYLTGKLYNKTRGQEMIASLIVGFFANGVYWVIALILVGTLIPVDPNHVMIIPGGIGIVSTIDMGWHPMQRLFDPEWDRVGLSYAMDWIWRVPFGPALTALGVGLLAYILIKNERAKRNPAIARTKRWVLVAFCVICAVVILLGLQTWLVPAGGIIILFPVFLQGVVRGIMIPGSFLSGVREIPAVTGFVIIAVGLFIHYFLKTKLGQDCRSVGQSQHIANVSGINVDRTRLIATMISTVLAAWGMIIWMQNIGTINTYGAHMNIGLFAVATILVGGATSSKANVKNAMIGVVLFNAMFIVSPEMGRLIAPNNANVGEYTRSFMVYGIIGLSLGLHVWKANKIAKEQNRLEDVVPTRVGSGERKEES